MNAVEFDAMVEKPAEDVCFEATRIPTLDEYGKALRIIHDREARAQLNELAAGVAERDDTRPPAGETTPLVSAKIQRGGYTYWINREPETWGRPIDAAPVRRCGYGSSETL